MLSMEKFTVTGGGTKVSLGSLVTNCSGAFSQGPPEPAEAWGGGPGVEANVLKYLRFEENYKTILNPNVSRLILYLVVKLD
jgi:hypothetical protein